MSEVSTPIFQLLVLKTQQMAALREFYTRLGFQFVEEKHGNGPQHYSAQLGSGILEIYPPPNGQVTDSTTRFGFGIEQLKSVIESLRTDFEIVAEPKETPWGLRAVVRDSDGRAVEMYASKQSWE